MRVVFHVELRQFPYLTRAFNLSRERVEARILRPWAAGQPVELNERRWAPQKAKLTIYEGPQLATEELGLGRGWANVTRAGEDVTARLLAELQTPSALQELKAELLAAGSIALQDALRLATRSHPQWRLSERLALAEQAIWELLHRGALRMFEHDEPVDPADWQPVLLAWKSWNDAAIVLRPE